MKEFKIEIIAIATEEDIEKVCHSIDMRFRPKKISFSEVKNLSKSTVPTGRTKWR